MAGESRITKDHDEVRNWTEKRGGRPAVVNTGKTDKKNGIIRFNFPGFQNKNLEDITWDEFFEIFDKNDLALLYQDKTKDGKESRFFKFIRK